MCISYEDIFIIILIINMTQVKRLIVEECSWFAVFNTSSALQITNVTQTVLHQTLRVRG